jgi:UDP-N-acetyl-2-amino-2-deoxyglucuronate dehydrogenase
MPVLRAIQVGVGGVGKGHFGRLLYNDRFDLVAICDAYPKRPDVKANFEAARARGIPTFTDYRTCFDDVEADAVFICTPHHWHAPMTVSALRHGMHVFVEKPAATSVADVNAMMEAQKAAGKLVAVGFNPTAGRDCIGLKRHIARGDLGAIREVVVVVNWFRADEYYRRSGWVGRRRAEGKWCRDGVIYNQASHYVAAALNLANTSPGPAMSVGTHAQAALYRGHPVKSLEMEDLGCAAIALDGDHGRRFYLYATTCNPSQRNVTWLKVFGEKGQARLGADHLEMLNGRAKAIKRPAHLADKHDNFHDAITRGATLYSPLDQAVKVTQTIDAIYRAAAHRVTPVRRRMLDDLPTLIARAAAQRCLFGELDDPPAWA